MLRAAPDTSSAYFPPMSAKTRADAFLSHAGTPVISDLDTRALVRHLRTRGVMRGLLSAIETDARKLVEKRAASLR
jgi:carbamoyl-phosphate synthase small subunit